MKNRLCTKIELCDIKLDKGHNGTFEGYASVFGGNDSYNDTIEKGAFKNTIKNDRTPSMFINHDSSAIPVGDWLNLNEDSKGLIVVGKIDLKHKDGPSLYSALERKAMDGISIGFVIPKGGSTEKEAAEGTPSWMAGRTLSEITLKEMSIVNFPADDAARILAVKSDIEQITDLKTAERYLRDVGFSIGVAKSFVSRINNISRRDVDDKLQGSIAQEMLVQNQLTEFINNLQVKL